MSSLGAIQGLKKERLGLLWGGWSKERAVSRRSARAVEAAFHRLGLPFVLLELSPALPRELLAQKISLAFLALHGPGGEDGTVQGVLDVLGVAYTGCGVRASAVAMHKPTTKAVLEAAGIATPPWQVYRPGETEPPRFPKPWVVKPASQGSALGIGVVARSSQWVRALRQAWALEPEALVEPFVAGSEVTVAILGEKTLPVVEIIPAHAFYDFHSKYAPGGSRHLIPTRLSRAQEEKAARLALKAFQAIGGRHLGRVDLRIDPRGRPWVLEINTLPGFTPTSLYPEAARAAGINFDALILDLLCRAREDRKPLSA